MSTELTELLDESLRHLQQGASLESCLAAHPERAHELEPLLRAASALQQQAARPLPPAAEAWLAQGRREIEQLASLRLGRSLRQPARRPRQMQLGALLSIALISFMLLGFVDSAAAQSMPGDYLYSWKLAHEQISVALTWDPQQRSALQVELVQRRAGEMQALLADTSAATDPERMRESLDRLSSQVAQAVEASQLTDRATRQSVSGALDASLSQVEQSLAQVALDAPASSNDDLIESAEVLVDALQETVAQPLSAPVVEMPSPTAEAPEASAVAGAAAPASAATADGQGITATATQSTALPTPIRNPVEALTPAADGSPAQPGAAGQPQPSPTPSPTLSPTKTATPKPISSATNVAEPTQTSSAPSATLPVVAPPTQTLPAPTTTSTPLAPSPTLTPIASPTAAESPLPTSTPSASPSPISAPPAPTATATDTAAPTDTATPTATDTDTATPTNTITVTATDTAMPTPSDTATATATAIPTDTATPTATATATPTTPTPTDEASSIGLRPILECVEAKSDGSYVAHFGYESSSLLDIVILIGARNGFSPAPLDRGQPQIFLPGRSAVYPQAAFSVPFSESLLVWTLDGRTASANPENLATRCAADNSPSSGPTR